jgi:Kef-type K+ transport system membrane component KefB
MKKYNNIIFFILINGGCLLLMYFIDLAGEQQELGTAQGIATLQTNSNFEQFSSASLHNISNPLAILLLQIAAIILVARFFGFIFSKIGQPSVIGEIAAGIFLGPSLIGMYFPKISGFLFPAESLGNLEFLSQIGVILFMFIVGMELDLKALHRKLYRAVVVSNASIILPFTLGMGLAFYMYQYLAPESAKFQHFALFIGIAMSITAFPVLARILKERGLSKTGLGTDVIACAAIGDIIAWCVLAAVVAIVKAGSFASSVYTIILAMAYIAFMLAVVKPCLEKLWARHARRGRSGFPITAIFFVTLLVSSYCTQIIGIHAIFGAFMAGVIMPSDARFRNVLIKKIEEISLGILLPIFFVFTGLRTQIGLLNTPFLWGVTGLIILVAVVGKFIGSALAARYVGESWRNSLTLGALMNTRGLMELVVLNIGYDLGILTPEVFSMMVIMALTTTCMAGPSLSVINRFLPEKKTDEAAEGSLSPEKILIPVDDASWVPEKNVKSTYYQ